MKRSRNPRFFSFQWLWKQRYWLLAMVGAIAMITTGNWANAQSNEKLQQQIQKEEQQLIQQYTLPDVPVEPPVYQEAPAPAYEPEPTYEEPAYEEPSYEPAPEPAYEPEPVPVTPEQPYVAPSTPAPVYEPEPAQPAPPEPQPSPPPGEATPTAPFGAIDADADEEDEDAEPLPRSEYVLEFNRAPAVGDRLRLNGTYDSTKLGFTRPRNWKLQSVKAAIRFQHSPALIANLSNLTVRVNDASIGSIPLNRPEAEIGNILLDIPLNRLQDYNEISFVAQQHNFEDCTQEDPGDPTLWTEILPDSQMIFKFELQPIPLDFSRYPYPFFDSLSLQPNRLAFLAPKQVSEEWLAATARYSAQLGRLADYRPLETRIVESVDKVQANERLVVIGTPEEQPELKKLKLPLKLDRNQVVDRSGNPLPFDLGVLMLSTARNGSIPVLVATGNDGAAVAKAIQALVQPQDRKLMTGAAVFVDKLETVAAPEPRQWEGYLPAKNQFQLKDLKTELGQPFEDVTVRGAGAAPIQFDFKALPDDRFDRGSSMDLVYSYGPQINPRTSAVEVLLDGVFIGGARLTNPEGELRKNLKVDLPANLIEPDSKIQVAFRLSPRERGVCGQNTDGQLTGTLHADTRFNLKRDISVELPNLELLHYGYPFAAPQDLSQTAIVLPDSPSTMELSTFVEFAQRLGRLSDADSVQLAAYTTSSLPPEIRQSHHLVGIGLKERFPFPEVFETPGFTLGDLFSRKRGETRINTLPDTQGVVKQVMSPFAGDRVLLALTAQTENGLQQVRRLFEFDPWFFQLQGDTTLVDSNVKKPSPYDPDTYQIEFFQQETPRRVEQTSWLSKAKRFLQEHWYVLPLGILAFALLLYGLAQLYIKRMVKIEDSK
ncbi:MAG TPA: cellulose biosynthesis cyclic di-GMP-binding regulatory protein BcsB [Oscillatoriales cyanobacterium M4454_W2019_049]|nr:cellulose biosynthesis cyclic di-GMP-binding regulatory protein BcsB [Oscillatoriales cyanobacterium M4454_W2019_049]